VNLVFAWRTIQCDEELLEVSRWLSLVQVLGFQIVDIIDLDDRWLVLERSCGRSI
jgi:hypothetical protein